jgi:hypothetical protein
MHMTLPFAPLTCFETPQATDSNGHAIAVCAINGKAIGPIPPSP